LSATQLQRAERLLDVRAEEACSWLIRVGDELEGEEHGGTEDVEGTPGHVAWYGEACVGQEIRTCMVDESDQFVSGADGDV
jgi:hypothetical protein